VAAADFFAEEVFCSIPEYNQFRRIKSFGPGFVMRPLRVIGSQFNEDGVARRNLGEQPKSSRPETLDELTALLDAYFPSTSGIGPGCDWNVTEWSPVVDNTYANTTSDPADYFMVSDSAASSTRPDALVDTAFDPPATFLCLEDL
jgi:hypothetical protein